MAEQSPIGGRIPRVDAAVKAIGEARYASDVTFPNMLHGKILRSPLAHARILNTDISRALKLPGVKAVVTGKDTAGIRYGTISVPEDKRDKQGLATDKVRYVGDDVAAVAAIDEDTAQEALQLIQVDYGELPAVLDPEAAVAPGAPQVHAGVERNISRRQQYSFGNLDECFEKAFHVREDRIVTPPVSHVPLETHAAVAVYESSGRLTVWTSTQAPFFVQDDLALTLQLPKDRVRVIKPPVGGGFGGKSDGMDTCDFCAALLSMKTGRPVRIAYTREEEFLATRRRHPAIIYLKTAVDRDGTILAKEARVILDGGAYNFFGAISPILCGARLMLPYRQQAIRYEGYRAYTNNPPSGAMRGYASPQMHFAQDVQMDLIARDIAMDPQELRTRNALEAGETLNTGLHIHSSGFGQTIEAVGKERPLETTGSSTRQYGWGMGCAGFPSGAHHRQRPGTEALSAATVRVDPSGGVLILSGGSDVGQGLETTLCQIVAAELAVPMEKVRIIAADTELTPLDMGSFSSRATMMAGNAAKAAAGAVKEQLLEATATTLEASLADLEMAEGRIFVKGSPDRGLTFADAVRSYQKLFEGKELTGKGVFNAPPNPSPPSSFGTNGVELAVDAETGQVSVLNITAAHDCGVPINPMSVEGQLQGSIQMGMGYALSEKVEMAGPYVLNPSMLDYKIPTSVDMPDISIRFVKVVDPRGPFGAKEAGEGTVGPTAPGIANAILKATGTPVDSLPITPERVLALLESPTVT